MIFKSKDSLKRPLVLANERDDEQNIFISTGVCLTIVILGTILNFLIWKRKRRTYLYINEYHFVINAVYVVFQSFNGLLFNLKLQMFLMSIYILKKEIA